MMWLLLCLTHSLWLEQFCMEREQFCMDLGDLCDSCDSLWDHLAGLSLSDSSTSDCDGRNRILGVCKLQSCNEHYNPPSRHIDFCLESFYRRLLVLRGLAFCDTIQMNVPM